MNRELEFRAWNNDLQRYFTIGRDFTLSLADSGNLVQMWCSDGICDEFPADAIEQFTGLFDCNGRKIFEGDIVDLGQAVNGCSKFIIKIGLYGVEAEYAENMISPRNYEYCIKEFFAIDNVTGEGLFVIGNIHEAKI